MRLDRAIAIEDLREMAQKRLPDFVFHPMETGSGNGYGPRDNIASFREFRFIGKVLTNLQAASPRVAVFEHTYNSAFGIAPMGYADYFRRKADSYLAVAAAEANVPFVLSGGSNATIEEIAAIAPETTWCQLYGARDSAVMDDFMRRARDSGVRTLVFTVDFQAMPQNDWLARTGLGMYARIPLRSWMPLLWQLLTHPGWTWEVLARRGLPALESWRRYAPMGATGKQIHGYYRTQVPAPQGWQDLERVRRQWSGNLVVKGLMTVEDARSAMAAGADAIMVSNHGGNRLDCLMPPILVLSELRRALGPQIPLFLDGGIRRGIDILTAYCLGASFSFVGRAVLYGVAAAGLSGAQRAVRILSAEVQHAMSMLGISDIPQCHPAMLQRRFQSLKLTTT